MQPALPLLHAPHSSNTSTDWVEMAQKVVLPALSTLVMLYHRARSGHLCGTAQSSFQTIASGQDGLQHQHEVPSNNALGPVMGPGCPVIDSLAQLKHGMMLQDDKHWFDLMMSWSSPHALRQDAGGVQACG